jgi:hypothetical protein
MTLTTPMRCPQQWLRDPSQRNVEEGLDGEIEMITPASIFRTVGRVSRPSSGQNSNHSGSVQHDSQSRNLEREEPVLPAADGGFEAWMMLAASMLIQVPVWGMLRSHQPLFHLVRLQPLLRD